MSEQTQALSVVGNRTAIEEIKTQLAMLPGGKKMSEVERYALAQLAVAHGFDPFNGEIWIIPGSGPMIGIKGLRRKAREQLNHGKDGNFWTNFVELRNPPDRAALKIPEGALAFECRLFDTETIKTYVSTIKQLKDAGMPWEIIEKVVGAQPYTSGYGYWKTGEQTRMTPVQCAMKRAEADAIKRRFDIPLDVPSEGDEGIPDMADIQGEWKVADKPAAPSPEQRAADNDALFGADDFDHPAAPAPEAKSPEPAQPQRGTMEDFENLFKVAKEHGMRVASVPANINPAALVKICEDLRTKINAEMDRLAADQPA